MYHFVIHSFIDRHLGCFYTLATVNNASMNKIVHIYFWINVFIYIFFNKCSETELLGHIAVLFLIFWEILTPLNSVLISSHSPQHLLFVHFFSVFSLFCSYWIISVDPSPCSAVLLSFPLCCLGHQTHFINFRYFFSFKNYIWSFFVVVLIALLRICIFSFLLNVFFFFPPHEA